MVRRKVISALCSTFLVAGCAGQQQASATSSQLAAPSASPDSARRDASRARLRAVIRDRSFLDNLPEAVRASTITEPFYGRMVILYLVDDRGAARGAQAADLAESGVTREALRAVVEWNLSQALSKPLTCTSHAVTEPAQHNYYESSRLLLEKQWADLAARSGTIVVAVPSNDTLFVACNPTQEVLKKMAVIVQNSYPRAARPVSPSLLTWTKDGFRELPAP